MADIFTLLKTIVWKRKVFYICAVFISILIIYTMRMGLVNDEGTESTNRFIKKVSGPPSITWGMKSTSKSTLMSGIYHKGPSTQRSTPFKNDSELHSILEEFKSTNKPVMVTVINDAYMPFARSWLCNTMFMNIHQQVLVIATDKKSRDEISIIWPNVKVISLPNDGFHGNQNFGQAGYIRIMVKRTELILQILQQKVEILLFDLDQFWKTDPMPLIIKSAKGYDIAGVPVSGIPGMICGGFIYMKPTESMIKLWSNVTEKMLKLGERIKSAKDSKAISTKEHDQSYVTNLLKEKYAGIKLIVLNMTDFPDGHYWYDGTENHRKAPFKVLHNNFIIGNNRKIERAQKFNHWFWDSDKKQCDIDLVKKKTTFLESDES